MKGFLPVHGRSSRLHNLSAAHGGLAAKLCSCLAAVALSASLVPTPAWAHEKADGPAAPTESAQQQRETPSASVDGAPRGEADSNPQSAPQALGEKTPDATPAPSQTTPPSADAGGQAGVAGGQAETAAGGLPASPSAQAAPPADTHDAAPYTVGDMDYVLIQATQDQQDDEGRTGEVREGDTLWANVFDFFSDDVIAHEASWSYQWLAAPSQSENVEDYVAIPGQTSQSLTFTKELARQLKGSYLAVKVTAGDVELVGSGTMGIESDSTPGPVIAPPSVTASASVIGAAENGSPQIWAAESSYTLDPGATAADLSEAAFKKQGIAADFGTSEYGWHLDTVTSPLDGRTLGWDAATGRYWALFVNGKYATKGAGSIVLQPGDTVSWFYTSGQTLPGTLSASCNIVGVDADGNPQTWAAAATYPLLEGATAADLSEAAFKKQGIAADFGTSEYGWHLDTVTSPLDGRTLGWDAATGRYWALFVNGKYATKGAGSIVLQPGDTVSWFYTSGQTLPDSAGVVVDPSAPRPDYSSSWPGFGNGPASGVVVGRPTPTQDAELAWTSPYRPPGTDPGTGGGVSDPLIVGGDIYLVAGDELRRIDATSGNVKASRKIGGSIRYFCRPVYADGLIVVPTDALTLSAFTADTLTCVWRTSLPDSDASDYQALSSLTIGGGQVFAGFTVPSTKGALMCVRLSDGKLMWSQKTDSAQTGEAAGYYWSGAAVSGSDILIGDEAGKVSLIDGSTGAIKSAVSLGAPVRAGIVAVPEAGRSATDKTYLAVTNDGTMHKIERTGNALTLGGSVRFAQRGSTSTPAVYDGKAYVCGAGAGWKGVLCIVDIASMTLVRTVQTDGGEAKSSPLVSVQGKDTYVYFTCNSLPGGVWGYRVGDESAHLLFDPPAAQQNYCTASIIADEKGNLYYTNDSGYLIALKGKPATPPSFPPKEEVKGPGAPPAAPPDIFGPAPAAQAPISTVPASPIVPTDAKAAHAEKRSVSPVREKRRSGEDAQAAQSAESAATSAPNPWAVGGIAVGVIGLAAAATIGGVARHRSKTAASSLKKGN